MIDREDLSILFFWAPRIAIWVVTLFAAVWLGYWLGHLGR